MVNHNDVNDHSESKGQTLFLSTKWPLVNANNCDSNKSELHVKI